MAETARIDIEVYEPKTSEVAEWLEKVFARTAERLPEEAADLPADDERRSVFSAAFVAAVTEMVEANPEDHIHLILPVLSGLVSTILSASEAVLKRKWTQRGLALTASAMMAQFGADMAREDAEKLGVARTRTVH